MENLEEVLQALDDFQKMRPTEIPRELEDYLCWVAKTGDPVYQWPLIKTLFREKLTRVMTDFYETCPTLELAPCPNVEHFNYDTMKTNLLERLESFANAPFTVQRICELLTAPRKEYNRVDKFMRAIEKNILVVSTREPGPIARRSENGDGMVNGSVDEEAPVTQPPQDVEMEYWEKDCASTVTISVHTVENETPMLQTVIPTSTVVKNVFSTEEVPSEKLNSNVSKPESSASTFIPTTSEFTAVTNVPTQTQSQESVIPQAIQSLPATIPEGNTIVNDVPEAVMNEDTSSQPSLDLETEEGDSTDCTKKLQTTFQAKDFTDTESSKPYQEDDKTTGKTETGAAAADVLSTVEDSGNLEKSNEPVLQSSPKPDIPLESNEPPNPPAENVLQTTDEKAEENSKPNVITEVAQSVIETTNSHVEKSEDKIFENSDAEISSLSNGDAVHRIPRSSADSPDLPVSEAQPVRDGDQQDQSTDAELLEVPETTAKEAISKEQEPEDSIKINQETEASATLETEVDEPKTKSIVPETKTVLVETKESESTEDQVPNNSNVVDSPKNASDLLDNVSSSGEDQQTLTAIENTSKSGLQDDGVSADVNEKETDSVITDTNSCKKLKEQTEMMEVDEEDSMPVFRQEEPMEQETVELSKS